MIDHVHLEDQQNPADMVVTLDALAELAGFPVELVKRELLLGDEIDGQSPLPLSYVRELMMKYLNKSEMQ